MKVKKYNDKHVIECTQTDVTIIREVLKLYTHLNENDLMMWRIKEIIEALSNPKES